MILTEPKYIDTRGLVSIITPTYNRAAFLPKTLQSVLYQTYKNFELLVIDDGSTDNTREVLSPYLRDPRVQYHYQKNQGQSVARSYAYSKARGEMIAFLDSDDWWTPDKLKISVDMLDSHPEVALVYTYMIIVDENGCEISRQNMRPFNGKVTAKLLLDNFVPASSALARKKSIEMIGGIQSKFRIADDYDLWLRISTIGEFYHVPKYLMYYRQMPDQISSDKSTRLETNEEIISTFLADYPTSISRRERRDGWSYFYNRRGRYFAERGMIGYALKDYMRSFRNKPWSIRPWRSVAALTADILRNNNSMTH